MESIDRQRLQKENMIMTLVVWSILFTALMWLMLYTAQRKTIVISDVSGGGLSMVGEGSLSGNEKVHYTLTLQEDARNQGFFRIPFDREIKAEDVVIENRYQDRELWVYIKNAESAFYREHAVYGDLSPVSSGFCEEMRNGIILKMQMNGIWEYHTVMENNTMQVTFQKPKELYRYVIVIDPMGGGEQTGTIVGGYAEKSLALQVAQMIPEKLEGSDCKLYFTRWEDVEVSEEDRIALVEDLQADFYIRIAASADMDDTKYGISALYNENYFIPEFGNVELADKLTQSVTIASSNRAAGIFPAEEDSILQKLNIPAAQINLGYLTNEKEDALLGRDTYRGKLAQGIADAILQLPDENSSH